MCLSLAHIRGWMTRFKGAVKPKSTVGSLHFLVHTWKTQAVPSDSRRRKSFLWVFLIRDSPEILAPNVIPQGLGLNMQMGGGKEAFRTQQCVMTILLGTHHAENDKSHVSLSSVINLR